MLYATQSSHETRLPPQTAGHGIMSVAMVPEDDILSSQLIQLASSQTLKRADDFIKVDNTAEVFSDMTDEAIL